MIASHQRTIQIGQVLHGYDGGHTLLASSESFTHMVESALFMLSDLSGPQIVPGFEEYITGYPLEELSVYAFAKTWYAPEMERPGCVWTHTLLIRAADLPLIEDYTVLLREFFRPVKDRKTWKFYEKKLSIEIPEIEEYPKQFLGQVFSSKEVFDLLAAVYGQPDVPVFLPAESSGKYEALVLRLWSQQWPRLRRTFRFCTGSLESRSIHGLPFDLQIIPFISRGSVKREFPDAIFVGEAIGLSSEPQFELAVYDLNYTSWLQVACEYFQKPNPKLRQFLREFGADVSPKRSSYVKLLQAFDLISHARSGHLSFDLLVDKLLTLFPSRKEATKLKSALLNPFRSENLRIHLPISNQERLIKIVTLDDSALPDKMIDSEWAQSFLKEQDDSVLQFVQFMVHSQNINSIGQQLLDGIAANIRPEQLQLAKVNPSIPLMLTARNPRLATNPIIWRLLAQRSHELLDILATWKLSQDDWNQITGAAIEAHVPNVAPLFGEIVGASAIHAALDWAEEHGSMSDIGQDWHQEFGKWIPIVAEWLMDKPVRSEQTLKALTEDLNPYDSVIFSLGADRWLPIVKMTKLLSTRSNVFMFILGCQNPRGAASVLTSRTFEQLHRAASLDALGNESWLLLREILPVSGMFRDWDICERLRRLLVSRFVKFSWPLSEFLMALEDAETLERTLQFVVNQRDLRPFARQLINLVESGETELTNEQLKLFHDFEWKLRRK